MKAPPNVMPAGAGAAALLVYVFSQLDPEGYRLAAERAEAERKRKRGAIADESENS